MRDPYRGFRAEIRVRPARGVHGDARARCDHERSDKGRQGGGHEDRQSFGQDLALLRQRKGSSRLGGQRRELRVAAELPQQNRASRPPRVSPAGLPVPRSTERPRHDPAVSLSRLDSEELSAERRRTERNDDV